MRDWLVALLNSEVNYLHSSEVVFLKSLLDSLVLAFDVKRFEWALLRGVHHRLLLSAFAHSCFSITFLHEVVIVFRQLYHVLSCHEVALGCLMGLIDLYWWHQLPFSQQLVNLSHKLEGGVLLI